MLSTRSTIGLDMMGDWKEVGGEVSWLVVVELLMLLRTKVAVFWKLANSPTPVVEAAFL